MPKAKWSEGFIQLTTVKFNVALGCWHVWHGGGPGESGAELEGCRSLGSQELKLLLSSCTGDMQVVRLNWTCLERWDSTFLVPVFLCRSMVRRQHQQRGWRPPGNPKESQTLSGNSPWEDITWPIIFYQAQRIHSLGRDLDIPMPNWPLKPPPISRKAQKTGLQC